MICKKYSLAILLLTFLFSNCTSLCDREFDSNKWKIDEKYRYEKLKYLNNCDFLIGKSKEDVLCLLGKSDKMHHFDRDVWMYVISLPYGALATQTPVVIMDVYFKNNCVSSVDMR